MKRKLFSLLLAAMLIVMCIPVVAGAEEGMFIVYAKAPEGWEQPCIWAWDDNGTNPDGFAWPGGEMTADENNPGWWYYYLPDTMTNVIINGNGGTVQTKDYKVEPKDMWLTVTEVEGENAELAISYEALTVGELPAYVAPVKAEDLPPILLYASIPDDWQNPCIWAWDKDGKGAFDAWPGGAMTADENNPGWYYLYVPGTMQNVIVNANEGGIQTKDYAIEGNTWMTVTPSTVEGENAEIVLSTEQLTTGELPAYEKMIKVSAYVQNGWETPCLWAWDAAGKGAFDAWPGGAMTQNADGWYSIEVPAWIENVIINNNGDGQTADYAIESGKDVFLVVGEDATLTISYEKPDMSEKFTIHAYAPEGWMDPGIWSWSHPDGTNVFVNWPGAEMNDEGNGWFAYDLPTWVNRVIINANMGGVQTADIEIEAKELWLVIDAQGEYTLTYEKPEITAAEPEAPAAQTETPAEPAVTEAPKAEEPTKEAAPAAEPEAQNSPVVWPWIAGGAVVLAGAGAGIGIAAKKKKEQ